MIGDKAYEVANTAVLYDADGKLVAAGKTNVLAALTVNDEIEKFVEKDGVISSITAKTLQGKEAAEERAAAVKALEDAIKKAEILVEEYKEVTDVATERGTLNTAVGVAKAVNVTTASTADIKAAAKTLEDAITAFKESGAVVDYEEKKANLEYLESLAEDKKFELKDSDNAAITDIANVEFKVSLVKDGAAEKVFNIDNLENAFSVYNIDALVDALFTKYETSETPMSKEAITARVREIKINTSALKVIEGHLVVDGKVMDAADVEFLKAGADGAYNISFFEKDKTSGTTSRLGKIVIALDGTTTLQ